MQEIIYGDVDLFESGHAAAREGLPLDACKIREPEACEEWQRGWWAYRDEETHQAALRLQEERRGRIGNDPWLLAGLTVALVLIVVVLTR